MTEKTMNDEMGGEKEYLNYLESSMVYKKEIIRQIESMYDNDEDGIKKRLANGDWIISMTSHMNTTTMKVFRCPN